MGLINHKNWNLLHYRKGKRLFRRLFSNYKSGCCLRQSTVCRHTPINQTLGPFKCVVDVQML